MFPTVNKEKVPQASWVNIYMAEHQKFPLEEFKTDLENIQTSLARAESDFSQDQELQQAFAEAKDSAIRVIESFELEQEGKT